MKENRLVALTLITALMAGCSPHGDIAKRSIVTVAAVTRQEEGCQVTVEYLTHLGKDEDGREIAVGEGKTFAQAVTDIETDAGKHLYLDNCRILLLDGFGSREELTAILEEVDSFGGIRPLTLAAVCGHPDKLLEEREEGEASGDELFTLLTGGELSRVNLRDCLNLLNTSGRGLLLPVVERKEENGEERIAISGYLSPGARGTIEAPESLGELLPFAKPEESHGKVYTIAGDGYSADWVLEKNSLSIHSDVVDGSPFFTLSAKVEGYLLSRRGELDGHELERRAEEDIRRRLLAEYCYVLENISTDSGNDIFSLGKYMELFGGRSWKEFRENWEERLPEIGVEISGSVLLRDEKRLLGHG